MKDWSGNNRAYITTNGFANLREGEREKMDYYATEPKAVELLLELEDFTDKPIWECACGEGHLSKAMEKAGLVVRSSDIIDRGYGEVFDFLSWENTHWDGHIITNPPYKLVSEFIIKALEIVPDGSKVAYFMPIRYLEGKERKSIYRTYPPKTIYVSSSRLICAINGDFNKHRTSAIVYAWYVWVKGYKGDTILKWFN